MAHSADPLILLLGTERHHEAEASLPPKRQFTISHNELERYAPTRSCAINYLRGGERFLPGSIQSLA
ncbi:MAG TPA: hypothetical protein VF898_10590, partial [Chloroflexota bacterium]